MSSQTNRQSLLLIVLLCITYGFAFMHRQSVVPFFYEFTIRFSTGYAEAGALMSAFFGAYAISLTISGYLTDRIDNRLMIIAGGVMIISGTTMLVWAPTYAFAFVSRTLTGIGVASMHCPIVRQISELIPTHKRGTAMAAREIAIAAGILASLSGLPFLAQHIELNRLFFLICLPMLAAIIFIATRPRCHFAPIQHADQTSTPLFDYRLIFLVPIAFFAFAAVNGLLAWLPTMLRVHHGMSATYSGIIVSTMIIASMPSALISGRISDKLGKRALVVCILGVLILAGLPGWYFSSSVPLLFASGILVGAGWGGTASLIVLMAAEIGGKRSGWTVGLVTTTAQGSSAITSYVLGLLLDVTGTFLAHIIYMSVCTMISIILCFAAHLSGQRQQQTQKTEPA